MKSSSYLHVAFLLTCGTLSQDLQGAQTWVYEAGTAISSSPTVGYDGTVYLGLSTGLCAVTNNRLTASNKWLFSAAGATTAALASDGTVYFASADRKLYAVNPDGSKKWAYEGGAGAGAPAIGADGTIYIHMSSLLHAVSPSGAAKWTYPIGGSYLFGSPVIAPDGAVYAVSPELDTLYAISAAGASIWSASIGPPGESPAIGADGAIYAGANLQSFLPDGTNQWISGVPGGFCPVIGMDGTIYVARNLNFTLAYGVLLSAVTPAGTLKWQYATNLFAGRDLYVSTPVVDSAGKIYVSAANTLFAIAPPGNLVWAFTPGDGAPSGSSPTLDSKGTVYSTFGSRLYAIAAGTNGPADSPWPMYRGNARHTGRIERPSLQKPRKQADSGFGFDVYARTDKNLTIESSTNLHTWQAMTSFVPRTVPAPVVDHTASNSPVKFYRAVEK